MKQVVFSNPWRTFFEELGFRGFEDFFDAFEGTQINKNTKRSVLTRTFEQGPQSRTFFLKRFFNPHFKDMLFALYNWRRPCSQGRLEWNCANYLLSHGIGTYRPACFGEISLMGVERRSFFLTEKLPGMSMMDFLKQHWSAINTRRQEKFLSDLAGFIRRIHGLGVSLPDLYVYHIFVEQCKLGVNADGKEDAYSFAVIDLHRMSINVPSWRMPAARVENLARLNFSLRDEYISPAQRQFLLRQSLNDLPESKVDDMIEKILRRGDQLRHRRKQPVY
jgi:hypothetical protein